MSFSYILMVSYVNTIKWVGENGKGKMIIVALNLSDLLYPFCIDHVLTFCS